VQLRALVLALCLVLSGCSAAPVSDAPLDDDSAGPADANGSAPPANPEGFADPASDRIGWEDGYWYDEPISVDQSDGLSDAEMEAFVGRAMARVERIRHKEFTNAVPVTVIPRSEYRNQSRAGGEGGQSSDFDRWNNQVWEALFITGEGDDSQQAIGEARGSSVVGFYSIRDDEIKIVTDSPDEPTVRNATLIHELVHALQDQHWNLSAERFRGRTQDGDLAVDGIVEGDASYVERTYAARCAGEWDCVPTPAQRAGGGGGGGGGGGPNLGIVLTTYQPYSDGAPYVAALHERGGWDAVDAAYEAPPVSTEQTIHLTDEEPVTIRFTDEARNGWRPFPNQGVDGSDTVGEASMYAMFWYQARAFGAQTIDPRGLFDTGDRYDVYNYSAQPTAGWGNDRVFPYRKQVDGETQYGYVWVTAWDSRRDARQFHETYRRMLGAHGVEQRGESLYVIPDGEFADAFRVVRDGRRVVIVNGPTPAAVDDIRPGLAS